MLLEDGPRIIDLVHLGRDATALQRSYEEAEGIHCDRPGCDRTTNLELHHVVAWSPSRVTTVRDLAWLCPHDHDLVTHHGHTLTGPPGQRTWTAPDGTTTVSRPPPTTDAQAGPPPHTAGSRTARPPEPGSQFSLFA